MKYDVLTLGETMLRLSPVRFQTLEQAGTYEVGSAGTESNVAVGLARLGLNAAWVSKLAVNPMGRKIAASIQAHGVDVSHIIWTDRGRVGTAFMEMGPPPRSTEVVYDRANSAASQMTPEEIDWALLQETRHVHLTGITPALSKGCRGCVETAIAEACKLGITVSFDVNYRKKLWSEEEAARTLRPLMQGVAVLFLTAEDAQELFGFGGSPEDVVRQVAAEFQSRWTVLTLGGEGAMALTGADLIHEPGLTVETVDRIGAGDAFVAGFLYGFLEDDVEKALQYGITMSGLKMTTPGDLSFATLQQVEGLVRGAGRSVRR